MGLDDKIENKAEDLKGKAKEATGKATDDDELEAEGKTDQTKSEPQGRQGERQGRLQLTEISPRHPGRLARGCRG